MSDGCARTLLDVCYCVLGSIARVVFELFVLTGYYYPFAEGTRFMGCGLPSKLSRDLFPVLSIAGPPEAFLVVDDSRQRFCEVSRVFCAEL